MWFNCAIIINSKFRQKILLLCVLFSFLVVTYKLSSQNIYQEIIDWKSRSNQSILVVTGFINLGYGFTKGEEFRKISIYFDWMKKWSKITNHVICYTDDVEFYGKFSSVRQRLPTTLVMVDKNRLPSFQNLHNISSIFDQAGYPRFNPDTTNAPYVAVMNAKYDFLSMAMESFPQNNYVTWLDIGYFRFYPDDEPCFGLKVTRDFDPNRISFTEVYDFRSNLSVEHVIREHYVWICGCLFYGTREKMTEFIDQYRKTVEKLLEIKWIASDQQNLAALYSDDKLKHMRKVSLQIYRWYKGVPLNHDEWFHLGYLMRSVDNCTVE